MVDGRVCAACSACSASLASLASLADIRLEIKIIFCRNTIYGVDAIGEGGLFWGGSAGIEWGEEMLG